jgi:SAM-dependent methyltransferase
MTGNMKLFSDTENMRDRVKHAYEKIKWFLPEDVRHGRMLDIGCGTGNGVIAALQHGATFAVGVDRNFAEFGHEYDVREFPDLCIAQGVDPKKALSLEANIFESRFAPQSFDYAMMLDSMEHVPTPERFIKYAYECLRGAFFYRYVSFIL